MNNERKPFELTLMVIVFVFCLLIAALIGYKMALRFSQPIITYATLNREQLSNAEYIAGVSANQQLARTLVRTGRCYVEGIGTIVVTKGSK